MPNETIEKRGISCLILGCEGRDCYDSFSFVSSALDGFRQHASASRHACWLLIQSPFYYGIPDDMRSYAKLKVLECLENEEVSTYGKYRVLHHILKARNDKEGKQFRFLDQ